MGEQCSPTSLKRRELMYNKFKKFVFHNFSKSSYELISEVAGKEEIYFRDNKMVVLIEDTEVGKRIFDVAKSLKRWGDTISSNHITFKLTDFVADKFDTVQVLFANVEFSFEYDWCKLSEIEQLRELVSFAHGMQEKGYLIEDSLFNNESCSNLSDFLSFFKPNGLEEASTNGCLIKYIHHVLSHGGDIEEYYQPVIQKNEIRKLRDFPYHMPVIQMCYNYCKYGTVPENIDAVLKAEGLEAYNAEYYFNKLIVSNSDLASNLPATEITDTYTVYDGCIKIHKEISSEFRNFLEDKSRFLRNTRNFVEEYFTDWIIDFEGNIIGYKYNSKASDEISSMVLSNTFDSQRDILAFVSAMSKYLHTVLAKSYSDFETDKHTFNIETDLVCYPDKNFKILKIENLFNLVSDDSKKINEEITIVFFKLLLAYLEKTYGKLSDKQAIYEKKEVRYLSPILAREFCNFALERKVNISMATEDLEGFFSYNIPADENLVFDKNFIYNPSNSIPFLFEHEAENKYGIKMEKGVNQTLPDGRILVTLNRRENLYTLQTKIESIDEEINDKFGNFNKYVKLVKISEIIYSLDLNSNDLYFVAGYVTTPFLGKPLSTDMLLSFNNKEILKIAGMLMTNFGRYYIDWSKIAINITHTDDSKDDEFLFYINPLDERFRILRSDCNSERQYVSEFFEYLKNNGYNENAFIDLDYSGYNIESSLIYLAQKMDTYCAEHNIYYNSYDKMCPVCLRTRYIVRDDFDKDLNKLFEDKYAIHYKLDWTHNLKVYKEDSVNMQKMEANIDDAIDRALKNKRSLLVQECFIPYKKALDSNRKFIGYIYKSVNFQSTDFNNLNDTEHLENLPRIMSLVRLILQVKELIGNGLNFVHNPFGNVYLSKNHKKQVQISNVDFIGQEGKKKNTIKWTCEYVRSIINSDKYIELDTGDWQTDDLNSILNYLKKYAETLTMYCPIHKLFYSADYLFCPKCVDSVQLKKLDIEYISASDISSWKEFSSGGESIIYEYRNNSLAKIFKDNVNYSFKNKVLAAVLSKSEILESINNENHKFRYIIPKKILVDKNSHKILGYVMDEKIIGKPISVLRDTTEIESLDISRKDVLEILITVGEGIQTLHDKANIFIGDLNGRNILFDTDKNVYFLDFDGMGVDNISPVFCTEGYIDPVSQKTQNITKKDDWYSYAIQAFYYLTLTHPFNGNYEIGGELLEIPDKMERRLSLLGHHGITVPKIAIPWDWMSRELTHEFLNIFEGDSRKSIVAELKAQYQSLYGNSDFLKDPEEDIIPIGSKFVAKKNNPFHGDTVRIINRHFAICSDGNDDYYATALIHGAKYKVHFPDCMKIIDIMLLDGYSIAFAVYSNQIVGFNLKTDEMIFCEYATYDSDTAVINGNVLYLSQNNIIHQYEFDSTQVTKRDKIKFMVNQETVGFLVKFNSKFMLVKRTQDGIDKIYCNSEVLCEIDSGSNSKYNILYDDTTKMWLVISSNGKFITIKSSNGHHREGTIPSDISDMNVKNIAFNKGIIYIPSQDNLYIINVIDQMTSKKMECDKIMTPDSRLCNFNSQGFSVITDYILYDVCKK